MKRERLLLPFLAAFLLLPFACSCDWYPVTIAINVETADGHSRLDPDSEYFIGENVTAVYEGKSFQMEIPGPGTKAYVPQFFGLKLFNHYPSGSWYLEFGEFEGSESQDITVKLVWPDGTSDTIRCKHTVFTPLAVSTRWTLNGERTTSPVTIVK